VFLGLTLPEGEALLVPSLVTLLTKCLEAATKQRDPMSYLQLLRVLFRHMYNSRDQLKHVYADMAPHLSGALNTLLAMLEGPNCTEVGGWLHFATHGSLDGWGGGVQLATCSLDRADSAALPGSVSLHCCKQWVDTWVQSKTTFYTLHVSSDLTPLPTTLLPARPRARI
jgi:hypothetical protein